MKIDRKPRGVGVTTRDKVDVEKIKLGTSAVSSDSLNFLTAERSSKYDSIVEQALRLEQGKAMTLNVGSEDPDSIRNNLGAILRRRTQGTARSLTVRRYKTPQGATALAIVCGPPKAPRTRRVRAA